MKHTKLALSAVMIVAIGLTGANLLTDSGLTDQEQLGTYQDSTQIYGHVTVIHSDPDGNILSYAQTDNLLSSTGKDCMAELIFGGTAGTSCEGGTASVFNTIVLFNGQSFPTTMNSTILLANEITAAGLAIADGDLLTPAESVIAGDNGYLDGSGSQTTIANTFVATTTQAVDGAALFNGTPFDAVLAGQQFTSVTLNSADTLAVTWTITLG